MFVQGASAERGSIWLRFPGTNCVEEANPEDGWLPTNTLQFNGDMGGYSQSSFANEQEHVTVPFSFSHPTEVFCPVPYVDRIQMDKFAGEVDMSEKSHFFEIQVFVIDNNPVNYNGDFICHVMMSEAGVSTGAYGFDWEATSEMTTEGIQRAVLLWHLAHDYLYIGRFITIHCKVPGRFDGNAPSQIVGYALKKSGY